MLWRLINCRIIIIIIIIKTGNIIINPHVYAHVVLKFTQHHHLYLLTVQKPQINIPDLKFTRGTGLTISLRNWIKTTCSLYTVTKNNEALLENERIICQYILTTMRRGASAAGDSEDRENSSQP